MLDIEKMKAAALEDTEDEIQWSSTAVLDLIEQTKKLETENTALLVAIEAKDASLRLIKYETDIHGNNLNRPIRVEAIKALTISPSTAQLVIAPVVRAELEQVGALKETERGDGGFGSTGSGLLEAV